MTALRRPGEPLAAMTSLLGIWVVARIALWQPPLALVASSGAEQRPTPSRAVQLAQSDQRASKRGGGRPGWEWLGASGLYGSPRQPWRSEPLGTVAAPIDPPAAARASPGTEPISRRAVGGGHGRFTPTEPALPAGDLPRKDAASLPRVSGEFWAMFRPGSNGTLFAGPLVARYGASQAGGVIRYRMGEGRHRLSLYARTSAALDPLADRELALGASARPLPGLPLRAQAELRAREAGGSVDFAPAALVVSEIGPVALPLGLSADPYFAAGYVGGRQATPFVDGMLRIDRPIARAGQTEVRIGGGAWGGAQEGAAALDAGPSARLRSQVGGRPLTLALDYRLRLAGSAEPRSGVAVTLSAGF